jgi:hypothetical protein
VGCSDNRINTNPHKELDIDVRKVPADSVPYGESISTRGDYVWCAYDERGTLVCVAATADEARRKYRERKQVGTAKS